MVGRGGFELGWCFYMEISWGDVRMASGRFQSRFRDEGEIERGFAAMYRTLFLGGGGGRIAELRYPA